MYIHIHTMDTNTLHSPAGATSQAEVKVQIVHLAVRLPSASGVGVWEGGCLPALTAAAETGQTLWKHRQ